MRCSSFLLPPHMLDNIFSISTSSLETHRRSLQVKEEPRRYMFSSIPRVKLIFPEFDGFSFCINFDKNCEIWDVSIDGVDFCASRSPLTTRWNRMSPSLKAEFRLSKTMVNLGVLCIWDRLKSASSHEWVKLEGVVATTAEIDLFYNSTPSLKKRAESDAPARAEFKGTHFTDCFAMSELGFRKCLQYTEIPEDLKKDPKSHGGPSDCILLCRLREQVLRELGFQDIFKKVKDEENAKAISLLENVVDLNDAMEDEVKMVCKIFTKLASKVLFFVLKSYVTYFWFLGRLCVCVKLDLQRVKSALLTKAKQRIASTYGNKKIA
ncbi:hypothetical protein DVH24_025635 [Malus domestica]|uniref:Damage-control phosphatase ARMT1-like metal-binding domain-containing protein n=1 Tax=Malus domestica TaxID=3750 RepID=A0A498KE97_MALDO|nr:hypothetical protein DVH24_025635 [Malus domestica]